MQRLKPDKLCEMRSILHISPKFVLFHVKQFPAIRFRSEAASKEGAVSARFFRKRVGAKCKEFLRRNRNRLPVAAWEVFETYFGLDEDASRLDAVKRLLPPSEGDAS